MVRTPLDETTQNAGLYDLTIDGNRAKIPKKVDGFYTGVRPQDPRQDSDITVERVEVMNCCGYGFDPHEQTIPLRIADSVSHHNGLDGFVADFLVDSVYGNNVAYANDWHGFNVTTSTDGLKLFDNVAYGNGSAGLVIQRGSEDIPAPHDIPVKGGSYYGNARGGTYVKIADDVLITGVDVHGNQRQGIRLDGTPGVVVANSDVGNNSQADHGVYDEIRINRYDDSARSSGLIFGLTGNRVENTTIYGDLAARPLRDLRGAGCHRARQPGRQHHHRHGQRRNLFRPATGHAGGQPERQCRHFLHLPGGARRFLRRRPQRRHLVGDPRLGPPLPTWLSLDPLTGQFKGTPPVRGTF